MEALILHATLLCIAAFAIFSAIFIAMVLLTLPYLLVRETCVIVGSSFKRIKASYVAKVNLRAATLKRMAKQMATMEKLLVGVLSENAALKRRVELLAAAIQAKPAVQAKQIKSRANKPRRVDLLTNIRKVCRNSRKATKFNPTANIRLHAANAEATTLLEQPLLKSRVQPRKNPAKRQQWQEAIASTALDYFKAEVGVSWCKAEKLAYNNAIWIVRKLKLFTSTRLSVAQAKAAYQRAFWFAFLCQQAMRNDNPAVALKNYCKDLAVSLRKLHFDVRADQVEELFSQ